MVFWGLYQIVSRQYLIHCLSINSIINLINRTITISEPYHNSNNFLSPSDIEHLNTYLHYIGKNINILVLFTREVVLRVEQCCLTETIFNFRVNDKGQFS